MSSPRQVCLLMAAVLAVGSVGVYSLSAQTTGVPLPSALNPAASLPPVPPIPQPRSPVAIFRELLAMSPVQREISLTNRPPAVRTRILAKVAEYEALPPGERELRLRATELQWYLLPLMRLSPVDRAERLALVPDDLRRLVDSRLGEWDILPPPLQQEFLDNERAVAYFTQVASTNASLAGDSRPLSDPDAARWNGLSDEQRERIANQFKGYFTLPPQEKQKTLDVLSDAERQEMEKTLQTFAQLPPLQRRECVLAFTRFATMSPSERREFLQSAQRWSKMTAKERQTWRDLVANVPPLPPMPPMPGPPMPPLPQVEKAPKVHPAMATNHN